MGLSCLSLRCWLSAVVDGCSGVNLISGIAELRKLLRSGGSPQSLCSWAYAQRANCAIAQTCQDAILRFYAAHQKIAKLGSRFIEQQKWPLKGLGTLLGSLAGTAVVFRFFFYGRWADG